MDQSLSNLKQSQTQEQLQRLLMLPQMQQALHILQMPALELKPLIETYLAENPLVSDEEEIFDLHEESEEEPKVEKELTFDEKDFSRLQKLDDEFREQFSETSEYKKIRNPDEDNKRAFLEQSICKEPSLFEFLMEQARETFSDEKDVCIAELLIGNFDENGFLTMTWNELAFLYRFSEEHAKELLKKIQQFEPYGVGASSIQESFLIQLELLGKKETLAYSIISKHYDDMMHNRIPTIQKKLCCTKKELTHAIKHDIALLSLHPGTSFSKQMIQTVVPDITLEIDGDELKITVNDDFLPPIHLNPLYFKMLEDPSTSKEAREFLDKKLTSLRWLLRNIHQRNTTLERIVKFLTKKQYDYLTNVNGKLFPMVMKLVAEELGLHESTITRAISNKFLACPRGVIPLKDLFSYGYTNVAGEEISSETIKEVLKELINREDKSQPLSDTALSNLLKEKGLICARRTVAKYRCELNQGNAHQRKTF